MNSTTSPFMRGLSTDEPLARIDDRGTTCYLGDVLGSSIALTDSAGGVATEYTYEPFGGASATGVVSQNPFQFSGRENDGTGLYYYRARYYDSKLSRFLQEDPIGLAGGANLYAYVLNSPTNFRDPLGLEWEIPPWLPSPLGPAPYLWCQLLRLFPSGNYFVGGTGNLYPGWVPRTGPLGGEVNAGIVATVDAQGCVKTGPYVSYGSGAGFNVGVGVQGGYIGGGSADFTGVLGEATVGVGPVSGTAFWNAKGFAGGAGGFTLKSPLHLLVSGNVSVTNTHAWQPLSCGCKPKCVGSPPP